MVRSMRHVVPALLATLILAGCGGGGNGNSHTAQSATAVDVNEPNAPKTTGNTATDGFNWLNFRRQQLGLTTLSRNAKIDNAAQDHSVYQRINNVITHEQTPGAPGFTGQSVSDRLTTAGYLFTQKTYAYGEVISSASESSGFSAAEDLIAAIYHRFVIFEPMFLEGGAGAATVPNGVTYFTANFSANGLGTGLERGNVVTYPSSNQQRVPRNFFSDHEAPDPVPEKNEVGYPISVHANITSTLSVESFSVRPRSGAVLPARLLANAVDPRTLASAAAIVPLEPLKANTTYDVQFTGKVDGVAVTRAWSFMTQ